MNKYLKYTLVALPILVGGYFIYKQLKPKKDKGLPPTPPSPSPTPTSSGEPKPPTSPVINVRTKNDDFPLKKGSKGARVRELQGYILKKNPKALPRFGADGDFGNETEGAMQMLFAKMSVKNQAELDEIKKQSLPVFQQGSPLVFQYQSPTTQVTPFLNLPK